MELKRLCRAEGTAWEMVLSLYENAFPYCERREASAFAAALEDERFHCMLIHDDDETPVGFLTWWDAGTYLYLEHFATLPAVRGRGYGRAVLDIMKQTGRLLVLEAELPEDELTRRRVGFYTRAGFITNPHRHLQPPYHADKVILEMRLMTYPRAVSVAEYDGIYRYIWQVVSGEEPAWIGRYYIEKGVFPENIS